MNLNLRAKQILLWVGYPLGYVALFCIFAYVAFPYERLKERIVIGYNAAQASSTDPNRMSIGDATWSWRFPGVVLSDIELVGPKPEAGEPGQVPSRRRIHVQEAYARVSPLAFLFGTTRLAFAADGFGGALRGEVVHSDSQQRLRIELEGVDPGQMPGVSEALQLPISGSMTGTVLLSIPEGKYSQAEGDIELVVDDLRIGDGKTKVRDMFALPPIQAGTLELTATATQGRVKLERFETKGPDLEATAEGKLRLRDEIGKSLVEQLTLTFKFSDAFRDKDDTTRSLLGKPGDSVPGVIDLDAKVKQAKQPDGSYSWRVMGVFSNLAFAPQRSAPGGAPNRAPPPTMVRPGGR